MTKTTDITPRETKSTLVRKLLSRKSGADIATLQEATGWQAHSVRAALSTLRKADYAIDRMPAKKSGALPVYRITATPEAA